MSLNGKSVVITRPKHQADELAILVTKIGGKPRITPTVEIGSVPIVNEIKIAMQRISDGQADIIIFMSKNGVQSFLSISDKLGLNNKVMKSLEKMKVVSIGSKTKKLIEEKGIHVDITPDDHTSLGLADALSKLDMQKKIIAIPRTDKPTNYLNKSIQGKYKELIQFPVYETRIPSDQTEVLELIKDILANKEDIITFTSSATARNLFLIAEENELADNLKKAINDQLLVVSIGPVTKKTLEDIGVKVQVTPSEYTIDAMVDSLGKYFEKNNKSSIDNIDNKLLEIVQKSVPISKMPWEEIGEKIELSGSEVLTRLKKMKKNGTLRKWGPIIDARKVGLKYSTLIGMRSPQEKIDQLVECINSYDEVSHNYERPHHYNIWFTITAQNKDDIDRILQEIQDKTGVKKEDILNLPTEKRFKIKANVKLRND